MVNIFKEYTLKRLYYHYNLDIWGVRMLRGTLTKARKRILELFEYKLRRRLIVSLKPAKIHFKKQYQEYLANKLLRSTRPYQNYWLTPDFSKKTFEESEESKKKKSKLRYFFAQALALKYTTTSYSSNKRENNLISSWRWYQAYKLVRYYPQALYKINFLHFYSIEKPKPRIRRTSEDFHRKLRFLRAKYYYCFNSINTIKNYIRKFQRTRFSGPLFIGLEANILNLIFRTNIFPTTRYIYNLLKIGGILVNSRPIQNPHKILALFDTFRIAPRFIKISFKFFLKRIQKGLVVVNIPDYISFNYKLMHFYIWRQPTTWEKNCISSFPFLTGKDISIDLQPSQKFKFLEASNFYYRRR